MLFLIITTQLYKLTMEELKQASLYLIKSLTTHIYKVGISSLYRNLDCKISRCVHLTNIYRSIFCIGYPTEQEESETFFAFILEVGHERNIACSIL